jgi:hypothetical protein
MRKMFVTLAALALLAGGAGLATGATGASSTMTGAPAAAAADETIVLTEREVRFKFIDVGAKGESVGDFLLSRSALLDDEGDKVGRVLTRCMLTFLPDLQCDGVYKLAGRGDIAFSNVVDTAKEPPTRGPIVGGDGDFANITGQLTFDYGEEDATVSLEINYLD